MRHLFFFLVMSAFMVSASFAAGETETECPMMREDTSRKNPKVNLEILKPKSTNSKGSTAQ